MTSEEKELIPPGWDYNPSSWRERIPIILLALIGAGIASYLTLFQLEIIPTVWDPFFGEGSKKILTSSISKLLPIPDAMLGALSYLSDALAGIIGGKKIWKTMPWIVILFGLAVGPLGFVSILLVISQPVFFNAWCTLCLCSALISISMIGPAMDEVLASLQYLKRVNKTEYSWKKAFWGKKEIIQKTT
jgi:uncharacterized membrane protein